ncbi:BTB/POZ domain [Trinorchestia longiramus]|nr:BTB/POZ domain [Trinorchestia longiramus]
MSSPSNDLFMLEWNDHSKTFLQTLRSLQTAPHLTDAHLACRGKLLPVHKFVLATCSEYFREIFSSINSGAVVVALQDVELDVLESLITFMYVGKVSIKQDKLGQLIHAAECFRIKGLAGREEELVSEFCGGAKTLSQECDALQGPKHTLKKRERKRRRSMNDHVLDSEAQLKKHFKRVESTRLGSVNDLLLAGKFMQNKCSRSLGAGSENPADVLGKKLKIIESKIGQLTPNVFAMHNVKEEEVSVEESDFDSSEFITGLIHSKFDGNAFSSPQHKGAGPKFPSEYVVRSDSPAIALNLSTSNAGAHLEMTSKEKTPPRFTCSAFLMRPETSVTGESTTVGGPDDEAVVGQDHAHVTRPDEDNRLSLTPLTLSKKPMTDDESLADARRQQQEDDRVSHGPATPCDCFSGPPAAASDEDLTSTVKLSEKNDSSGDSGTHSQSSVRCDEFDVPAPASKIDERSVMADASFCNNEKPKVSHDGSRPIATVSDVRVDHAIPMLTSRKSRISRDEGPCAADTRRLSESLDPGVFRRSHDEVSFDSSSHDEGRFNSLRDEENGHETLRAARGSEGAASRDEDGGFNDGSHDGDFMVHQHDEGELSWRHSDGRTPEERRSAGGLEMFNCKVDGIDCVCIDRLTDALVEHHFSGEDAIAVGPNLLYVSSRQCPICSYHTKTPAKFSRHIWQHKRLRTLCCTLCNYRTVLRPSFVVHLRQHTGEKPFKCTYCDYSASQKGNLFVHMKKHQVSELKLE